MNENTVEKSEERLTLTYDEWVSEGIRRFGPNRLAWRFVCPCCGHVASIQDWKDVGAGEGAAAFSCIGRWSNSPREAIGGEGKGPCNYAGGGLFKLNPVTVSDQGRQHRIFAFAPETEKGEAA